jgi:hypothetical protein
MFGLEFGIYHIDHHYIYLYADTSTTLKESSLVSFHYSTRARGLAIKLNNCPLLLFHV